MGTAAGTAKWTVVALSVVVCVLLSAHSCQAAAERKQKHDHYLYEDGYIVNNYEQLAKQQQSVQQATGTAGDATAKVPILTILGMTSFMSAMSGLGAVPFFFCGKLKPVWAGLSNAVACGVMLAASFDLLHEGAPHSPTLTILGMVLGAIFIKYSQEYLSQFEDASFEELSGADARKAMLIVGVMAAHAFGEGSGVGVSFSGNRGWAQGTLVTIAIGLHNIPEGMAVATVMVSKGAPASKALFWSLFCAFPQALVAVPSYMFVETFQSLLPLAMGFAAGCMVWIVAAELMPDALETAPHPQVATATTLSAAWLQGLSMLISTLETPHGTLSSPFKADPTTLMSCAIFLAVPLALQCVVAGAASSLLPSLPVALGAASSAMLGMGAADLAGLLIAGQQSRAVTLLWAALGAILVVALKRNFLVESKSLQVRRSLDTELASVEHRNSDHITGSLSDGYNNQHNYNTALVSNQYHQHHDSSSMHLRGRNSLPEGHGWQANGQAVVTNGNGLGANGTLAIIHEPLPSTMLLNGGDAMNRAAMYSQHNGTMHAVQPSNGYAYPQQQQHGPPHPNAYPGYMNGHTQQHLLDSNPSHPSQLLQQQQGAYLSQQTAQQPFIQQQKMSISTEEPPLEAKVHHALSSSSSGMPPRAKAALLGGFVLVGHACCSLGLRVTKATAEHAAEVVQGSGVVSLYSHWALPIILEGVPLALTCAGLSKAVFGATKRSTIIASAVCVISALLTVVVCLSTTNLGQAGTQNISHLIKMFDWTRDARAASAGAMLAASGLLIWPAAVSSKAQKAQSGAILGLLIVGFVHILLAGLCTATPSCIR